MDGTIPTLVSLLTSIGMSAFVGAYFQARLQQRNQINQHGHDLKQKRYLCILMVMIAKLRPDVGIEKLKIFRPDLRNMNDIDEELSTELLNGFVYASDGVLQALSDFIRNPHQSTFLDTAVAMRLDLWGKKTSLKGDVLETLSMSIATEV